MSGFLRPARIVKTFAAQVNSENWISIFDAICRCDLHFRPRIAAFPIR